MTKIEQYRIDGHKLALHPRRVADWLEGRDIAPLYLEISPSGTCNHRCCFCAMDFQGYQRRFLPADILKEKFGELSGAGVRAVMFGGEGEPLLHREMPELAVAADRAGLDVAFTTNGCALTPETAATILPHTKWIKVSFNAGAPETYTRLHRSAPDDYQRVLRNAEAAASLRAQAGGSCALGFQMLLLPENRDEATALARRVRDLGWDYLVIKPHAIHPQSGRPDYRDLVYGDCSQLAAELAELNSPSFQVVFRHQALKRRDRKRPDYERCLALPFWAYVDSQGGVWTCLRHLGQDDFYCGNLLDMPLKDIFGPGRQQKMARCAATLDITDCHSDCRMDPINAWLWELTHPGPHVNFI